MIQVFGRELRAGWKNLLFWSLGMLALAAIGFIEYRGLANAEDAVNAIFELMPRIVRVMFGMAGPKLNTPQGYYGCMYLWLCLLAFTHAGLTGATLIAKEERDKTADFLFTRPARRGVLLGGKLLAGVLFVAVVGIVTWGTTLAFFLPQLDGLPFAREINLTMAAMLLTQLVYLLVGMLCAAAAKDHKRGVQLAAAVVLLSYFAMVFIEMADAGYLDFLTPFRYFYALGVMENGLRPLYLGLAAAVCAVAGWLALRLYGRRDLRV